MENSVKIIITKFEMIANMHKYETETVTDVRETNSLKKS